MGDPKDDGSDEKRRIEQDAVSRNPPGHSVWKWATDSGRHLIESTSALLKRLEVPGLRLEDDVTGLHKRRGNVQDEAGGGYDPYGGKRSAPVSPRRPAAKAARPPATKPAAALPARRSWWRRLFGRD